VGKKREREKVNNIFTGGKRREGIPHPHGSSFGTSSSRLPGDLNED